MSKELVARGQATITTHADAYTLTQSLSEYIYPAASDGRITDAVSVSTDIKVTQGDRPVTGFTIGAITKPTGFSSISVDNTAKRVTFTVAASTTSLADHGKVDIPVTVAGTTYHLSFVWSKAKAGTPGAAGADANMLDWVKEWNTGKTLIDQSTVITPKLFAGVKNADGTLTGTAIGRYVVTTKNAAGTLTTETVDGISGFKDGYKTFFLDSGGNAQLGRGDQYIRYNAATGKVEFGAGVCLQWVGATYIDKNGVFTGTLSAATVNAVRLNASQITAGKIGAQYIDVAALKSSLITAGNIEALTLNVIRGKVGGWSIDADSIYRGAKNNTSGAYTASSGAVTLGSTGLRGYKWRFDATGAGAIAGGNILWDAAGKVTFANSVSVAWQAGIDTANELARAMAFGKMLYRDPTFRNGLNGIFRYDNSGKDNVSVARVANSQAPNDSGQVLEITTVAEPNPGQGGFTFLTKTAANHIFITRFIAKFPVGYKILWATNSIGTGGTSRCLTSAEGTGKWEEYIFKVVCGSEGTFSSTNYFYLKAAAEVVYPLVWQVAYATVFDVTACEKYTTTINAEGIYTGSITAGQITVGTLSADRIAAGSIKADKLDAESLRASIINADYINGLSCSFVRGKIGGWIIGADTIFSGTIGTVGAATIQIRTSESGSGYWYTGAYRPLGIAVTWHQSGNAGHIVLGSIAASGTSVKTGFVGLQMMSWDGQEYFCLSANYQKSGGKELYCRIAGWGFDNQRIWKNSVSLCADGSITNGTKWKLNNDGSGQIASGNISWTTAGAITFAPSVSLNWTAPINSITTALGGPSFPKVTKITADGIYTGNLSAQQITTGTLSAERLDADGIKTSIINTGYINGLTCSFTKGRIGGWDIAKDNINADIYPENGSITEISLRSDFSHEDISWFYEGYHPVGLCIKWTNMYTSGHLSLGEIAHADGSTKYGYMGLQMMDWDGNEYFCLSAPSDYTGDIEPYNRIAGWAFDQRRIWKNNVSLDDDGSLTNGTKWQMNNDGSGRIASGNICWDVSGNISFSETVSVAWTAGINSITAALGGASFPKLTQISASGIYTGKIGAAQINVDTDLVVGGRSYNGSISVQDSYDGVLATLDRNGITVIRGIIGGWTIDEDTMSAAEPLSGHRVTLTSSGYLYNDNPSTGKDYWGFKPDGSATFGSGTISFAKDGSGYLANQNIRWDTAGSVTLKGTITATAGKIAGFTISGNKLVNTASDSSIEFSSMIGNASLSINSSGSLLSMRADSARTGISIQTYATGAKGISIIANTGSKYAIESYGPMQLGQRGSERWNVPGVLYIGSKYATGYNSSFMKIWGDGVTVSSFTHTGSGQYKVVHNLNHTNYTVLAFQFASNGYHGSYRLIERAPTYFILQNMSSTGGGDSAAFDFIIMGRNTW